METNVIYNQDNVQGLKEHVDNNSIDLTVTSPPYDDLREYGGHDWDFELLAKQLYRVTKQGGIVVWVVNDQVVDGSETGNSFKQALYFKDKAGFKLHDTMIYRKNGSPFPASRDDNRYTQIFEYMFVFSKGKPNATLICDKKNRWAGHTSFGQSKVRKKNGELEDRDMKPVPEYSPRNNIWKYNTGKKYSTEDDFAFDHPAIFPEKLAKDHIKSWSDKEDIVLDPFMGSGTTAKMASKLDRKYVGFEINEEYCEIAARRTKEIQKPLI